MISKRLRLRLSSRRKDKSSRQRGGGILNRFDTFNRIKTVGDVSRELDKPEIKIIYDLLDLSLIIYEVMPSKFIDFLNTIKNQKNIPIINTILKNDDFKKLFIEKYINHVEQNRVLTKLEKGIRELGKVIIMILESHFAFFEYDSIHAQHLLNYLSNKTYEYNVKVNTNKFMTPESCNTLGTINIPSLTHSRKGPFANYMQKAFIQYSTLLNLCTYVDKVIPYSKKKTTSAKSYSMRALPTPPMMTQMNSKTVSTPAKTPIVPSIKIQHRSADTPQIPVKSQSKSKTKIKTITPKATTKSSRPIQISDISLQINNVRVPPQIPARVKVPPPVPARAKVPPPIPARPKVQEPIPARPKVQEPIPEPARGTMARLPMYERKKQTPIMEKIKRSFKNLVGRKSKSNTPKQSLKLQTPKQSLKLQTPKQSLKLVSHISSKHKTPPLEVEKVITKPLEVEKSVKPTDKTVPKSSGVTHVSPVVKPDVVDILKEKEKSASLRDIDLGPRARETLAILPLDERKKRTPIMEKIKRSFRNIAQLKSKKNTQEPRKKSFLSRIFSRKSKSMKKTVQVPAVHNNLDIKTDITNNTKTHRQIMNLHADSMSLSKTLKKDSKLDIPIPILSSASRELDKPLQKKFSSSKYYLSDYDNHLSVSRNRKDDDMNNI
jgi:hypothetical protein